MTIKPTLHEDATLDQLAVGATGIVIEVRNGAETREHLAARGIGPGVAVQVLKGGDPLLVAIDQARWAIGRKHAQAVAIIVGDVAT